MLTRSASKKKTGSPGKSIKKKEEIGTAVDNSVQDYKVNLSIHNVPNDKGCCSPGVDMSVSVVPKTDCISGSNTTVLNLGGIVVNTSCPHSNTVNESQCKTNSKSGRSNPPSQSNRKRKGRKLSSDESMDESYVEFSPRLTSSARKRTARHLRARRQSMEETKIDSDSSEEFLAKKMSEGDSTLSDESETDKKFSVYKGMLECGGYRPEDFRKKPVVQIVPVSEEEIKAWSHITNTNSTVVDEDLHKETPSNPKPSDTEVLKMVRKKKLLEILKQIDLVVSKKLAEEQEMTIKNENGLVGAGKNFECLSNEGGKLSEKNSGGDDGICSKPTRELGTNIYNTVFGNFQRKFHGLTENEEETDWLVKYLAEEDSIETEIFDEGSLDSCGLPSPDVCDAEGLVRRQNTMSQVDQEDIPENGFIGVGSLANEKITSGEMHAPQGGKLYTDDNKAREVGQEVGVDVRGDSDSKNMRWVEMPTGKEEKEGEGRITFEDAAGSHASSRRMNVPPESVRNTERNESVAGVGAIQEGQTQYSDKRTVLSFNINNIKQKNLTFDDEVGSSSGDKKVKQLGKAETPGNDVTDLPPARTRRSVRNPETEPKGTPRTRNMLRTQSKDARDEDLTVTPRSLRGKSPGEVTEVTEGKRKVRGLVETPKRSRVSRKALPKEEETPRNDGKKGEELSSPKSTRGRARKEELETRRHESVEREPPSTPRTRRSRKLTSHDEGKEEKGSDFDSEESEVILSTKSRKSRPPMKRIVEESEGETKDREFDMERVSSPLKKKKEAAERLRAEEERLGQSQIKESESVVTPSPSPKKGKSLATPSRIAEQETQDNETPMLSPVKKKSPKQAEKSPTGRPTRREGTPIAEVHSSSEQKHTKSPKKQQWKVSEESESEAADMTAALSPTRGKHQSPKKRYADEPEAVDSVVASSPNRQKFILPHKKQHATRETERESEDREISVLASPKRQKRTLPLEKVVEDCDVQENESKDMEITIKSSPKRQKSKSPKGKRVEERASVEIESNDAGVSISSPERQTGASTKKQQAEEEDSGESITEEYMCLVSPRKQMMKRRKNQEDVELFLTDDSDSQEIQMVSEPSPKTKSPKREREHKESEPEVPDLCMTSSRKRPGSESPKKHLQRKTKGSESEDVEMCAASSPERQKSKSPKKTTVEKEEMEESGEENVDMGVMLVPRPQGSKSPQKRLVKEQEKEDNDSDVEMEVISSPKRQKSLTPRKKPAEKKEIDESVVNDVENVKLLREVKKQEAVAEQDKGNTPAEERESETEEEEEEVMMPRSKKKPETKNKTKKKAEDAEVRIPQLGQDFLASIPSKKPSIKVKGEMKTNEMRENKMKERKRKEKLLKKLVEDDGYIPLDVGGPTKFAVMELGKLNSSARHPAFDLKRNLMYGSRLKRIPYSQMLAYNMKVESRKMRF